MTGLMPESISCHLKIFEPGRKLDDYGHAVIRFENGALGTVTASQITHGRENDLCIEIDGTKGVAGMAPGRAEQDDRAAATASRTPIYTRNPERPVHERRGQGRLPACRAAIPRRFSRRSPTSIARPTTTWSLRAAGKKFEPVDTIYPNVNDGVEGMYFIQQSVASSRRKRRLAAAEARPATRRQ